MHVSSSVMESYANMLLRSSYCFFAFGAAPSLENNPNAMGVHHALVRGGEEKIFILIVIFSLL